VLESELVRIITHALVRAGVPASSLILEITKNAFVRHDELIPILERLRALGVRLAIDDCGSGYPSLSYLKRLPIHTIKLDRPIVAEVAAAPRDRAIVHHAIKLAHELGLNVVAEGIEEEQTLETLGFLGCDSAQGYHLCRPYTADD
jgi:EAL domain-containing protein (putative c-di-GMP-specific phosphodiesterase class I)